jgi:uncharacterized membrane protein
MKTRLAAFAGTVRRIVGLILLLVALRLVQFWFGNQGLFILLAGFLCGLLAAAFIVEQVLFKEPNAR